MSSPVETIKSRLSIVEVVGSYLKLEKAGGNFRACCPFHQEKTPSFFVSPTRETYHCFGCNRGGDIISFVQEIEGLEFLDALKILAERAGVELEPLAHQNKDETDHLARLLEEAVAFYERELGRSGSVQGYLTSRGLKAETLKSFRLGFAPAGWRNLHDHLLKLGFKPEEMEKVGLVVLAGDKSYGSRFYDRFRSRIMFPLRNPAGKLVGFSGRQFGEEGGAKYINTPQTLFFDKSRVLYGYDKGKLKMKQDDYCVLVEGQVDLLMSHQAGVTNTVATSGTALTTEHLKLIKRLTDNLILAYDYDSAGLKASWTAINLSRSLGLNVKIAKLPSGQDPADVIKEDPVVWLAALQNAKHYIDFMVDSLREEGKTGLDLAIEVSRSVLPYVKSLESKMEQAHFINKIAATLGLPEQAVREDLAKIKLDTPLAPASPAAKTVPDKLSSRQLLIEERLFSLIFFLADLAGSSEEEAKAANLLGVENFVKKKEAWNTKRDRLCLEAELLYGEPDAKLWEEVWELAANLRSENLKEELQTLLIKIKQAEEKGDQPSVKVFLERFREISQTLNEIKK